MDILKHERNKLNVLFFIEAFVNFPATERNTWSLPFTPEMADAFAECDHGFDNVTVDLEGPTSQGMMIVNLRRRP